MNIEISMNGLITDGAVHRALQPLRRPAAVEEEQVHLMAESEQRAAEQSFSIVPPYREFGYNVNSILWIFNAMNTGVRLLSGHHLLSLWDRFQRIRSMCDASLVSAPYTLLQVGVLVMRHVASNDLDFLSLIMNSRFGVEALYVPCGDRDRTDLKRRPKRALNPERTEEVWRCEALVRSANVYCVHNMDDAGCEQDNYRFESLETKDVLREHPHYS
ncbi:hypothetical protein X801_02076 [Opisthorchis viverrini]|uniref:Uncharacterized protein n=2 Tax=Opisthorchis viverrini TaxID=6198 RepID=A0A1S8X5L9_OPIVI|nr:hypothetical protein T265_10131 [Opisthorchis viverrini]KER21595.1 hypothetical protein T265_10131 [Opisthorchis viverrini]OON22029.1 hypothetical protein X801_02076 [Opisthorchis viverrini]